MGDIGVLKAISDLTMNGYDVLTPAVSEHLPFDIVAYKDGKFISNFEDLKESKEIFNFLVSLIK